MTTPAAYRRSMLAFGIASVTLIAGAGAFAAQERQAARQTKVASVEATVGGADAALVKAEADRKTLGQPEDRLASR